MTLLCDKNVFRTKAIVRPRSALALTKLRKVIKKFEFVNVPKKNFLFYRPEMEDKRPG